MRSLGGVVAAGVVTLGSVGYAEEQQSAPAAISSANRHLGFFFRVDTGPGFFYASEPYQGASGSLSGAGWNFGLSLGGALGEDNMLAAHLFAGAAFGPSFSYPRNSPSNTGTNLYVWGIGPEYTHYFMPLNLYLSASVVLTEATLSNSNDAYGGDVIGYWSTNAGLGLEIAVGKEWWVGDHWGLGIALRYALSWNEDAGSIIDSATLTTNALTLDFSATFNSEL